MRKQVRYSPEVRERAVRMVFEHEDEYKSQWAALISIVGKLAAQRKHFVSGSAELRLTRDDGTGSPATSVPTRKSWKKKFGSSGRPMRFFEKRRHISHRRSSTAERNDGDFCR